jgi:hypothetical protein
MFHDSVAIFTEKGTKIVPFPVFSAGMICRDTWALADSTHMMKAPNAAFVESNAYVVQATSPKTSRWRAWLKGKSGRVLWLDYNTEAELLALG